jgi:dTDP-4-dehydrorhamnose reductase
MRILVLGITGMLGNAMFRVLSATNGHTVYGTARGPGAIKYFSEQLSERVVICENVENQDALIAVFAAVRPEIVINCVGIVKQLADSNDALRTIPINALLPHRLAAICLLANARLVQISTDCVFSGLKGDYIESDSPDASDLYGRSKLLGEVDYPHALTLRTSIIGHELSGNRSLINWFLSQTSAVKGYRRAVFSGIPTVELAEVVRDIVIPKRDLSGVYHVAAEPLSKADLLQLVAQEYGKVIEISPSDDIVIDRSLNANRFRLATGYVPPAWPVLISKMREFG